MTRDRLLLALAAVCALATLYVVPRVLALTAAALAHVIGV